MCVSVSICAVVGLLWGPSLQAQNLSPSHPVSQPLKTIDLLARGLEVVVPMASEGQLSLGVVLTQVFQEFYWRNPTWNRERAGAGILCLLKQTYLFLWMHWAFVSAQAFPISMHGLLIAMTFLVAELRL